MNDETLKQTAIGADYLLQEAEGKEQPPIDSFLDYINSMKLLKTQKCYPEFFYENEIEATKEILKRMEQH